MNFHSFLKTPLFFGLCLSSVFMLTLNCGILSITGMLLTFIISVVYTILSKHNMQQPFKIQAILYSYIYNLIFGIIFPLPSAESYFDPELLAEFKESLLPVASALVKICGKNMAIISCLIILASLIITTVLIKYLLITFGNKLVLYKSENN
jgi:hypothetical protein